MSSAPDYCGWGAKQGSKVRTWKNRYFVLRGRELVYYSGAKSDGSGVGVGEKGRLQVVNVDYAPDRKNGLLVHGKGKTLKMTTASAQESRVLFRKIKEVIGEQETSFRLSTQEARPYEKQDRARREEPQLQTLDEIKLMARKYSTIGCEGWVEKLGQQSKVWKKRYMSLTDGILEYRKGPSERLSAKVHVTDVRQSSEYSNALEIEFSSDESLSDSDIICIRAESV